MRSLEIGVDHIYLEKFDSLTTEELLENIKTPTDERLYAIAELFRRKVDMMLIYDATKIDAFFLDKIHHIISVEERVKADPSEENIRKAKRLGFSDKYLGKILGKSELEMVQWRREHNLRPVYKMIDTCAGEFSAYVPYFYSTYEEENESLVTDKPSILVLGSGPIRIGQGVELFLIHI